MLPDVVRTCGFGGIRGWAGKVRILIEAETEDISKGKEAPPVDASKTNLKFWYEASPVMGNVTTLFAFDGAEIETLATVTVVRVAGMPPFSINASGSDWYDNMYRTIGPLRKASSGAFHDSVILVSVAVAAKFVGAPIGAVTLVNAVAEAAGPCPSSSMAKT